MDTQKPLKPIFYAVIGIAFIVSIVLNIFQYQQIKKLGNNFHEQASHNSLPADDHAPVVENAVTSTKLSKNGTVLNTEEVESLNYQLQATEEELLMVHEDLNKEMDRKADLAQQRRELQKQQWQSPNMKKIFRENIASRIADFVETFNISSEDAEAFVDILLAEQIASQELYLEADAIANPSEEDRVRYKQLTEELNAKYETQKIDLLSEAVYNEYTPYLGKWYLDTYQVGGFSESLNSNESLSDTQRKALVDALVEAQEAQGKEYSDKNERDRKTYIFPFEQYDEEAINWTVEYTTRRNEIFSEVARSVLSPSQWEKFEAYLDQEFDRTISNMKVVGMEYYGYDYDQEDTTETQEGTGK